MTSCATPSPRGCGHTAIRRRRGLYPGVEIQEDTSERPNPIIATVAIGPNRFNAIGIHFGLGTLRDGMAGMPVMGSMACSIAVD